MIWPAAMGKHF